MLDGIAKLRFPGLLVFAGVVLLLLGRYDVSLSPPGLARSTEGDKFLVLFGASLVLLACAGVALYQAQDQLAGVLHLSPVRWQRGDLELPYAGGGRMRIDFGRLETAADSGADSLVVLPANEFFDDECIRDTRSALGAFVATHFPGRVDEFEQLVQRGLANKSTTPVERLPVLFARATGWVLPYCCSGRWTTEV